MPLSQKELIELDNFLMSDDTSDETMMLDALDGYLTAIVSGPVTLKTSEWLPGFWVLGFGQNAEGELYVLGNTTGTPFETTGTVYKLILNARFDTAFLEIPAVDVQIDNDFSGVYRARLQLVTGSDPLRFELIQAEKLSENFRGDNASFNKTTGELNLPFIDITSTNNNVSTYAAELQLIPGLPVLTFELKQALLVK